MKLSRFARIAAGYVGLLVVGCIGLAVLTQLLDCGADLPAKLCVDDTMLPTIAQVVPATVVAIFVFALGTTFVIAQIVVPSRGSRSIGELFSYRRVRAVLVGGLALLGGSLLITVGPPAENGTTPWTLRLATVLVAATVVYIVAATSLIVWTFLDQLSPRLFKERLTTPARAFLLGPRRWTSEELFRVLRVLRGWLRTVNRVGESRDLQFGLEGVYTLIEDYAEQVWQDISDDRERPRLHRPPRSYREARRSPVTQLSLSRRGAMARRSGTDPGGAGNGPPWFADELGRALTRAVESGVRGNTLRRDLDRLLNLFELGVQVCAPCGTDNPVLTNEVQTLIRHLTEVALGVRQCEDWQRDWFVAPVLRLARIEEHLAHVAKRSTGWPGSVDSLTRTALVGWLLAADALICVQPEEEREAFEASLLERSIPLFSADRSVWAEPLASEEWSALEPEWDVQVESSRSRHVRLLRRFAKARRRMQGLAGVPRPATAR